MFLRKDNKVYINSRGSKYVKCWCIQKKSRKGDNYYTGTLSINGKRLNLMFFGNPREFVDKRTGQPGVGIPVDITFIEENTYKVNF